MTEADWVTKIVSEAHAAVVVELGAHTGSDTIWVHGLTRQWLMHVAIEADPRNLHALTHRMRHTGALIMSCAIAAHKGSVDFWQDEGNQNASGSIRKPTKHLEHFPHVTFPRTVSVPAFTLDSLGIRPTIDLIWCDIQGAERDMIAGGKETLARTRWLLMEAERVDFYEGQATRDELLAMLPDWELVDEWPEASNVLLRNTKI